MNIQNVFYDTDNYDQLKQMVSLIEALLRQTDELLSDFVHNHQYKC